MVIEVEASLGGLGMRRVVMEEVCEDWRWRSVDGARRGVMAWRAGAGWSGDKEKVSCWGLRLLRDSSDRSYERWRKEES